MGTENSVASIGSLPAELVEHVRTICGADGEAWLADLPATVRELSRKWRVGVEAAFPGGEYNFVAPATALDGRACVVKIEPPFKESEIFCGAKWLRSRDGDAAVRVYAEDRDRRAILIERVRPGLSLWDAFESDPAGCVGVAIEVLRRSLREPPADLADTLSLDLWFDNFRNGYRDVDFPEPYAERALGIYDRLSPQPGRTLHLHGDFHHGNVITSDERGPFIAIDAKGLVGHLGYEIAVFLNNHYRWQRESPGIVDLLDDAVARFAAAFEFSAIEVREWAFAAHIIGEWWAVDDGREPDAAKLAISEIWGI